MKNIVLSLFMVMVSFVSISQVIEIKFKDHTAFNSDTSHSYFDMIQEKNMVTRELRFGSENKYILDLDKKIITFFYAGILKQSKKILSVETKNNLIFLSCDDLESSTNKPIVSHIVINKNKNDKQYPHFTFYFISSVTNTSNGFISY